MKNETTTPAERKIVLASDHAGWELKQKLRRQLEEAGYEVYDVGCEGTAGCDYPDYAAAAARRTVAGEFRFGILICGTGLGMSLAAGKILGARAVCCTNELSAEMARRHNDANLLCLGARIIGEELAAAVMRRFLQTDFEGGRHARRLEKIRSLEEEWRSRTT